MFPLFSTTAQYRVMHLGHHDHVNDWEHDPELVNMGQTRMMDRFPMPVQQFLKNFYVRTLWPPRLFQYVWDNMFCITLGNARHPYEGLAKGPKPPMIGKFRVTSVLGVAYVGAMVAVLSVLAYRVDTTDAARAPASGCWLVGSAVCLALPSHWYFQQCLRPVVSSKATSVVRLAYFTGMELFVGWARANLGPQWGLYFWGLWVLPLFTSWPYLMLLRDLYQHANTDDGKLTNSRVILVNPILRWGMFIYGQDIHLTHHLYPVGAALSLATTASVAERRKRRVRRERRRMPRRVLEPHRQADGPRLHLDADGGRNENRSGEYVVTRGLTTLRVCGPRETASDEPSSLRCYPSLAVSRETREPARYYSHSIVAGGFELMS